MICSTWNIPRIIVCQVATSPPSMVERSGCLAHRMWGVSLNVIDIDAAISAGLKSHKCDTGVFAAVQNMSSALFADASYRPVSHSIIGRFAPPTTVTPRLLSASGSVARTIVASGNMGLSALTFAASRADCSIASISALHPAWSKGHTTMG